MAGELGVPFPITLEAKHVIPPSQLHVEAFGALGDVTFSNLKGENGCELVLSLSRTQSQRLRYLLVRFALLRGRPRFYSKLGGLLHNYCQVRRGRLEPARPASRPTIDGERAMNRALEWPSPSRPARRKQFSQTIFSNSFLKQFDNPSGPCLSVTSASNGRG
jgi:hypothetical protein